MIEAGLRAHGLSTGRYTSPHLSKVTERISIDGEPVPDETFVRIWDEIRPYLEIVDGELEADGQPRLTYFECLTILGFAVFADQPVNVAVIEVGLGGITDATNVGDGQVAVVTPISLDHTELLGETTEEIAYEKAGIIKPGGFLISAAQPWTRPRSCWRRPRKSTCRSASKAWSSVSSPATSPSAARW